MTDILNKLETLHTDAYKIGMRSFANTCLARAVGQITLNIRTNERKQRNPNAGETNEISRKKNQVVTATGDLDTRNAFDEHDRGDIQEERVAEEFGFAKRENPLRVAEQLIGLYERARDELNTMSDNARDSAMDISTMLDYMERAKPMPSDAKLKMLAEVLEIDVEDVKQMKAVQVADEQAQFKRMRPEIELTIGGLTGSIVTGTKMIRDADSGELLPVGKIMRSGADRAEFGNLSIVTRVQITKRVAAKMQEAFQKLQLNIVKYELFTELGKLPVLKAAAKELEEFSNEYERNHAAELREALGEDSSF